MRVDVDLTVQDFRAFGKAAYRRAKSLPRHDANPWRRRLILGACWLALVFLSVVVLRYSEGAILAHLLFGVLLALTFSGFFAYFFLDAQRCVQPDESGGTLGSKSYELTDIGVVEVSPHVESTTRWSGITAIGETPTHLFLFVDRCAGFIIPKRCFTSPSQAAAFRAFAREHARSAA